MADHVPDPGWTPDERAFADEIALVQQRIEELDADDDEIARLSRELRRAVAAGRLEPLRGRRALARLARSLGPSEGSEGP